MKIHNEFVKIKGWDEIVNKHSKAIIDIENKIKLISKNGEKKVFPKDKDIFKALNRSSFDDVSVVIVGQDPYHQQEILGGINTPQAMGLSFSVSDGVKIPRSLSNIYKELESSIDGFSKPSSGNLDSWSGRVLLLNSVLTVNESEPNSHKGIGWEVITKDIITLLSKREEPIVFLSWGRFAHKLTEIAENTHHLVIKTSHPSPLGARKASKNGDFTAFLGSDCFKRANEFLKNNNIKEIDWNIK